ncbi:Putative zinc-or iron-chelating domain-containing protein [Halobacillus karajensis]|uniref:Flagellin N-methylase n=1 Tax=Halobacillus karajensis TaxID=195088 RepID=A0A024P5A0_9BACI|nr:YkgJ family cysteine cluster protein [Halobacillus karajensis]CDQ20476.1 Flagellin N-methylase [Halobacillus karajensis]CDQ24055.1 Flagellin N-methylase [Halobacillus karajensis]CDQ27533.1 Flagellin N-methylase [Halobacillus karajensis]SEH91143.1 Putative zinc-or iron-chelating domain-containing protein [Halobacillus karajensis]
MSFLKHEDIIKRCEKINQSYEIDPSFFDRIVDHLLDSEQDTETVITNGFHDLLAEVDHEIERMEDFASMKPNCFMGCAFCCYFPIVITKMEAKMMFHSIEQFDPDRKEAIFSHWEKYFEQQQGKLKTALSMDYENPETKLEYKKLNLPCPMLDPDTQLCMAYEVRPIPCRTYLNYSNPQVCADKHMPKEPFSYEFLYNFYFGSINELIQALYENGEDVFVDYPMDAWSYDYLPSWIKQWREGILE